MTSLPIGWLIAILCLLIIGSVILIYLYVKCVINKKKSLRDIQVNDSYSRISDYILNMIPASIILICLLVLGAITGFYLLSVYNC